VLNYLITLSLKTLQNQNTTKEKEGLYENMKKREAWLKVLLTLSVNKVFSAKTVNILNTTLCCKFVKFT